MTLDLTRWDGIDQAILRTDGPTPDLDETLQSLPKFKFITDAFEAGEEKLDSADESMTYQTLHCTASSTITDLHGDVMTESCVKDMAKQARSGPTGKGLTIFLNHQYKAPEDVAGRVYRAQAKRSGETDENGAEIWDLHYDIALTRNNDRVKQMYAQVKEDGISLGVSIGAFILEYEYKDQEKGFWGGLIINKVLLVETSVVGIPANQRSWIQNGVLAIGKHIGLHDLFESGDPEYRLEKRLFKVLDGKSDAPDIVLGDWDTAYKNALPDSAFACIEPGGKKDSEGKTTPRSKRHYPHHDKSGKVDMPHVNNAIARMSDKSNYQCDGGMAHLKAHQKGKGHEDMDPEEITMADHIETDADQLKTDDIEVTEASTEPEQITETAADGSAEPTETKSEESVEESSEVNAEAAPESESTAEQTTESADQDTDGETPEAATSALAETAPEIATSLKAGTTPAVELVLAALEHAAEQVKTLRTEKTELDSQVASLTDERDKAVKDAEFAAQVLVRVAKSPLGRKTQFQGPIESFQKRLGGIYDEAFLKLMDETE